LWLIRIGFSTQDLEIGNLGGGSPLAKIAALPAEPPAG
jgi:hypothetical protein